jgi:hypothetical protein
LEDQTLHISRIHPGTIAIHISFFYPSANTFAPSGSSSLDFEVLFVFRDLTHYKHPLPEHIYEIYMKYRSMKIFSTKLGCWDVKKYQND